MLAEIALSLTAFLLFFKTRLWSFVALGIIFPLTLISRPLFVLLVPALLALVLETLKRL
ncbi:MAG: hypothetical protein GOV00_03480 [Candidatus Altiarchaeota archaeon]|nr:hypothetical protein [Candidatus Altiarchaeota archaeon]